MNDDMKRFLKRLGIFCIPFMSYLVFAPFFLPKILAQVQGPSTAEQIIFSTSNAIKNDYCLLILGNSRVYRGINPDMMRGRAYNYAHDNDNYNQMYYKLKLLEGKGKSIQELIISVDYFHFSYFSSTRNYVYGDILGKVYLKDYPNKSIVQKGRSYLNRIDPKKLKVMAKLFKSGRELPRIKENGQYIKPGKPKPFDRVQRSSKRLAIQEHYFEKIIAHCKEENIKLFLIMCPLRAAELENYTQNEIQEFHQFLSKYSYPHFFDFSNYPNFSFSDFTDITHLNEAAADRLSLMIGERIEGIKREY